MEKAHAPRSHVALTAIAAVLAFTSAPAFAQEAVSPPLPDAAAPTIAVPAEPAPPPSAVPSAVTTLVLPDLGSEPAADTPAPPAVEAATPVPVAAVPVAAPAEQAAPAREPTTRQARTTSAATAVTRSPPEPTRVPTASDAGTARDGALAQGDAAPAPATRGDVPATPPPAAAPQAANDSPASDRLPVEGIVGLLAALGVAGAGIALMTLRRRQDRIEPDYASPDYTSPDYADEIEAYPATAVHPRGAEIAPPAATAIPAAQGPVPLGEDRQALLETMVAAPPDAANPFTSHKARMRRARLILQHREHLQTQGKPFDWRTYRPTTKPSPPSRAEQQEPVDA
ncbi:hypothetical protein [Novosphingobium sp. ST904]|uniref:hypothetical protein n=1 Tax=Novosphingobium sp. ST904 TaxID=1684385 RepID=UPI001049F355|nr:hypothetical protein [Novosphingobium sp. ST904]TCM37692.1 hypothetical protein EDF59_11088 [Novosphingobium sp. ST904]